MNSRNHPNTVNLTVVARDAFWTSPTSRPSPSPTLTHSPHSNPQDFYEHLALSEKIVHGRVKLELVRPGAFERTFVRPACESR